MHKIRLSANLNYRLAFAWSSGMRLSLNMAKEKEPRRSVIGIPVPLSMHDRWYHVSKRLTEYKKANPGAKDVHKLTDLGMSRLEELLEDVEEFLSRST